MLEGGEVNWDIVEAIKSKPDNFPTFDSMILGYVNNVPNGGVIEYAEAALEFLRCEKISLVSDVSFLFDLLVPHSFNGINLDMEKHYFPAKRVSTILASKFDVFNDDDNVKYWGDNENFAQNIQKIQEGDYTGFLDQARSFAEETFTRVSFFPKSFKVKPKAQVHYAKKVFSDLSEKLKDPNLAVISEHFEEYVYGVKLMKHRIADTHFNKKSNIYEFMEYQSIDS